MHLSPTSSDKVDNDDILYQTIENEMKAVSNKFLFGDYLDDQKALRKILKRNKKNNISEEEFQKLSSKLNQKKNNLITNVKKLFDHIIAKYNDNGDVSLNSLIKKARKHASKFNVHPDDVKYFKLHYDNFLTNKGVLKLPESHKDMNDIAKQLGRLQPTFVTEGMAMKLSEKDKPYLHQIHAIHASTKMDFSTSYLHYHSYPADIPDTVVNTRFNPYAPGHSLNVNNFVHPVIAALFVPKINSIDNRFLLSNLASIISRKVHNSNAPMTTRLDAALFYDMTSDPNNDLACDKNVWADLQKRCDIQAAVRFMANSLRNGNVYDPRNVSLINELQSCRMSLSDAPFLMGFQDEAVVLRRIFKALSFRPIWLQNRSAMPIAGVVPGYAQMHTSFRTPMINVWLPPSNLPNSVAGVSTAPITLMSSLQAPQMVVENGRLVPRTVNIMHAEQVLIFNVHRNEHVIRPRHFNSQVLAAHLPLLQTPWQKLNEHPITFQETIGINSVATRMVDIHRHDARHGGNHYKIRSIVIKNKINSNDMIHPIQSTLIFKWDGDTIVDIFIYRPNMVTKGMSNGMAPNPITNNAFRPFTSIGSNLDNKAETDGDSALTIRQIIERRGSIFVYALDNNDNNVY